MKQYIRKLGDFLLMELTKIVMVFSLTIIIAGLLYYELSYVGLFISILIIHTYLRVITYNFKFLMYGSLGTIGIIGGLITLGATTDYLNGIIKRVQEYYYIYKTAITDGYLIPVEYQLVVGIAIGLVLCLIVMIIEGKKHAFILHLIMGISIILVAYFVREYYNSDAYFCYIGASIVYYYHLFYCKKVKKNEDMRFYPLAIHGILFAVILVYMAGYFYEKSPRPLQFVHEIGKTIDKYLINGKSNKRGPGGHIGGDAPNGSTVKYDSNETLKESVELSDYALLNVYVDNPTYLRGSTCNTFDGREWSNEVFEEFTMKNTEETAFGLSYYAGIQKDENWRAYFTQHDVSVLYRNITADVLFLPSYVESITGPDGNYIMDSFNYDKNGIATFASQLTNGFNYNFTYYKPRYAEKDLVEWLRKSKKGLYKTLNDAPLKGQLIEHAKSIRKHYLGIPKSMTERTYELAKMITKDAKTDYDKAKAIEQYLRSNYDYTYETDLPEDGDPVDHFLFVEKEGFCTYNATSMIMLLRMNNIPARFVKGFVVNGSEVEEELSTNNEAMGEMMGMPKVASNLNVVTGWDSHAWVEAYFEGYGWFAFEPTGGFTIENKPENTLKPIAELPEDVELNEVYDLEAIELAQKRMPLAHAIIIIVGFVLALVGAILGMRWKYKSHKYNISKNRFKYIASFHRCLLMLKIAGYPKKHEQTIREYTKLLAGEFDNGEYQFAHFANRYEICCYSDKVIPDEWTQEVEAYYNFVKAVARKRTSYWHIQSALFVYHVK